MENTTASKAVTARIADRLASNVGRHRFSMWFDRSARLEYRNDDHRLHVTVPNRVVADWIDRNFRRQLCEAASDEVGAAVDLAVTIEPLSFPAALTAGEGRGVEGMPAFPTLPAAPGTPGTSVAPGSLGASSRPAPTRRGSRSQPAAGNGELRYCLDDFIVGPNNDLAYGAALQLVEDGFSSVNPLFVHGGVGLGKTHLLQGLCHKFKQHNPQARVLYTTGEKFTNEFLTAMAARKLDDFRRRIRRLDLLAIDDVDFLAGKEKSQQEFFHSFDEIDLSGARVAMASDNHPKLIKKFDAALVSRCVRGLVAEIKPPDTATRLRIVKALAERRGLTLLESVLSVLVSRYQGSVREIEGVLAKLHAMSSLKGNGAAALRGAAAADGNRHGDAPAGVIGHALVNRLLSVQETAQPPRRITFDRILEVVSDTLAVSRAQILSGQKLKPIVLARSLVIHLARQMTQMSYPEIGAAINKASHSSIIAANRRIGGQMNDVVTLNPTPDRSEIEMVPLVELIDRLKQAIVR